MSKEKVITLKQANKEQLFMFFFGIAFGAFMGFVVAYAISTQNMINLLQRLIEMN